MSVSKFELIKHKVSGFGAAIVVTGALFKIMHWPGASYMLVIGLLTEACIFILYAIAPPAATYHWENVHPELLDKAGHGEHMERPRRKVPTRDPLPMAHEVVGNQKDVITQIANIPLLDKESVEKFNVGISNIIKSSGGLGDINKFVSSLNNYSEQLKYSADNLTALNAAYEIQLARSKEGIDASSSMIKHLEKSLENSQSVQETIQKLNASLNTLNRVYGNMVNAFKA
jgi:gliding motility-associated protein GldL